MGLDQIVIYFTIYSFIGWICEVVYCSYLSKRFVNRGFLAGPVCPIYGFGALLIISLLKPVQASALIVFLCGFVITSVLEYIAGWFLETLFHTKWWNYENDRFNLNGRVCLKNSIMFGILSVILMKVIHPTLVYFIGLIPAYWSTVISIVLTAAFAVDSVFTVNTLVNLNDRLKKLHEFTEYLKNNADILEWFNEHEITTSFQKLKLLAEEGRSELNHKLKERFETLSAKKDSGLRLMKAFPNMRSIKYDVQLKHLREILKQLKQKNTPKNS